MCPITFLQSSEISSTAPVSTFCSDCTVTADTLVALVTYLLTYLLTAESVALGSSGRQEGAVSNHRRLLEQRRSAASGSPPSKRLGRHLHVRHSRRKLCRTVRHGVRRKTRTRLHSQQFRGVRGVGQTSAARGYDRHW